MLSKPNLDMSLNMQRFKFAFSERFSIRLGVSDGTNMVLSADRSKFKNFSVTLFAFCLDVMLFSFVRGTRSEL